MFHFTHTAPFSGSLAQKLSHKLDVTLTSISRLAGNQQTITAYMHVARTAQTTFEVNSIYVMTSPPPPVAEFTPRNEAATQVPFVLTVPLVPAHSYLDRWCVRRTDGTSESCADSLPSNSSNSNNPYIYFGFNLTFRQLGVFNVISSSSSSSTSVEEDGMTFTGVDIVTEVLNLLPVCELTMTAPQQQLFYPPGSLLYNTEPLHL